MADSIHIPDFLNELARAGLNGASIGMDEVPRAELELCLKWGFPLRVEGDHVHLSRDADALIPAWIEQETPALSWKRLRALGYLEVGSTNEVALEEARRGAPSGTLIVAERQLAGRGRKGRAWVSPAGVGIYCTLVVRPNQPQKSWPLLTHASSVALAGALQEIAAGAASGEPVVVDLKWPNDVLLGGKKAAGILLETVTAREDCGAVIGVGINVHPGSVPAELQESATSVGEQTAARVPRRQLLVRFLNHFQLCYDLFERGSARELLERWKECSSMWNGTDVWVQDERERRPATTCGLTDLGALRIRRPDGGEETLVAGDVTIRLA